ncbi:deoxynucleoside kinase [Teredinibacter turnerae]|uniref:deoxynucleoside kinase n=1 Tax=Teredinibacter turnerae TaxID=2426 RepID=UPI0004000CC3|nr:deoxynucleoside kinase [Teredinibacter turnerae]
MGKIVVIEGIDGSGKNTQSELLMENLRNEKFSVNKMSFPMYEETFFGKEVGKYLDGRYGKIDQIPAEFAAILYAGDRYEKRDDVNNLSSGNKILILDRYVPSNIAHQCAKVEPSKRESLKEWIETLEYSVFALPKPDLVVFLDMPASISQELVMKKEARSYTEKKQDLHESDSQHLSASHECFRDLVEKSSNWVLIECADDRGLKSIASIQSEILQKVRNILEIDSANN